MNKHIIDDMNSVPKICPTHKIAIFWNGDWYCSECQQREQDIYLSFYSDFCSSIRLCLDCKFGDGEPECMKCSKYPNLPVSFFGRKNKCKHYEEYVDYGGW